MCTGAGLAQARIVSRVERPGGRAGGRAVGRSPYSCMAEWWVLQRVGHPQPPPSFLPPWGVLRVPLPRWRLQGMMEQLFDHTVVSPLLVLFSP